MRLSTIVVACVCALVPALAAAQASPPAAGNEETSAEAPDAAAVSPAHLRVALARYAAREPGVDQVVRAALEAARVDPERARKLRRRARRRGIVPTLRFRVRHGQQRDLSERQVVDGDDRLSLSRDDALTLDGILTFDLGRLVFARHEVPLIRAERALRRERAELVRTVVALYFERRRLQLERDLLGQRTVEAALRMAEIEALLTSFTGGAFARMMRESGHRASAP